MTMPLPIPFFATAADFAADSDTPREFLERGLADFTERGDDSAVADAVAPGIAPLLPLDCRAGLSRNLVAGVQRPHRLPARAGELGVLMPIKGLSAGIQ
jgi:hypothetical protein